MFDDDTFNSSHGDGDAQILALFREWCDLTRRADAFYSLSCVETDRAAKKMAHDSGDAVLDEILAIEQRVYAIPSVGAKGLAVKVYFWFHDTDYNVREDAAALSRVFLRDECQDCTLAVLRDVRRFVPEIPQEPESQPMTAPGADPVIALIGGGATMTGAAFDARGDDAILAKFREWIAASDACALAGMTADDDDPEWLAQLDALNALTAEIAEIPSSGTKGLAIKVFFAVWADGDRKGRRYVSLRGFSSDEREYLDTAIVAGVVRDAVRFVPELAPLCAAVLAAEGQAEDEQLSATIDPALPAAGDADLFAAERKVAELLERTAAIYREYAGRMTLAMEQELIIDALDPDREAAEALIDETAPQTLAGAAVKLRAIISFCDPQNLDSLRQVLAMIEREARPPAPAVALAGESARR